MEWMNTNIDGCRLHITLQYHEVHSSQLPLLWNCGTTLPAANGVRSSQHIQTFTLTSFITACYSSDKKIPIVWSWLRAV